METACVIGKRYRTRRGRVTLRERRVDEVERLLVSVDAAVAILKGGGAVRCRPELASCLARWLELMWAATRRRAAALGVPAAKGVLIPTSAYRPLGTSCASGTPFADPRGALDSQDDFGHWSGWAIDIPTRFTRESFAPVLAINECWSAAAQARLERPFRSEYWHWRPERAIRTAAAFA